MSFQPDAAQVAIFTAFDHPGVLFFPSYLPTSPMAMKVHKQLDRYTVHEGAVAQDEKWVHQTWVWPGHPQAYYNGVETGGPAL